jgi:DNA invertase Pin-like site-specific DNA recombinase
MRFAREWGWIEDRLRWFDDFGLTGAAAEHRPEYRELRRLVQQGDVGLVGVADLSRLGRDAAELLSFLTDCIAHDVLVAIDGKVSNPRDAGDWLYTAIFAILSQHGALNIRDTLQRGRIGQLQAGRAVTSPPVGYDKRPDGTWDVTKDLTVRAGVAAIFRVYLEVRSLSATVIRLLRLGVKVPVRIAGGGARLQPPTIHRAYLILRNPNYTPDYYYRRQVIDLTKPRTPRGARRFRKATPEEQVVIANHHDGYITREQWQEIQAILASNAWSRDHANAGSGNAIVGRWIRCSLHREWKMRVNYKRGPRSRFGSFYTYWCIGDYQKGGPKCRTVSGWRIDDAVVRAVLERLSPPSIAAVEAALVRALADDRAEQHHRQIEIARLTQRITELERKLDALDPDSFQVFKHVERQLETAKQELEALKGTDDARRKSIARQQIAILAEATKLASDIPRILSASTTGNRDRRELVGILVRAVVVEQWGIEKLRVKIGWTDQAPDGLIDVWLRAGIERLVLEMLEEGKKSDEVARALNEAGIKTVEGNLWNRRRVCDFVRQRSRGVRRSGRVVPPAIKARALDLGPENFAGAADIR